MKWFE